jgi:hypothetical protein
MTEVSGWDRFWIEAGVVGKIVVGGVLVGAGIYIGWTLKGSLSLGMSKPNPNPQLTSSSQNKLNLAPVTVRGEKFS